MNGQNTEKRKRFAGMMIRDSALNWLLENLGAAQRMFRRCCVNG
jgi:hypothetical protein